MASSNELLARRLAPCKPVLEHSPHAYKFFIEVLPHSSVFNATTTIMCSRCNWDHMLGNINPNAQTFLINIREMLGEIFLCRNDGNPAKHVPYRSFSFHYRSLLPQYLLAPGLFFHHTVSMKASPFLLRSIPPSPRTASVIKKACPLIPGSYSAVG